MDGLEGRRNTTTSPRFGSSTERTLVLSTGRRNPYENLFTKIKSPSTSPGIMDADGIRKGSTTNERNNTTIKRTGKKERANSTILGSTTDCPRIPALRLALKKRLS